MELSQARTRSTLEYIMKLPAVERDNQWLVKHFTANGLSSSRPAEGVNEPNSEKHQRVEFRIVTNADERIERIVKNIATQ